MTDNPTPYSPPWPILLLLAMLYVAIGPLYTGVGGTAGDLHFHDSDDAMRLLQVLDLKDGAGWHDLTQERLNPPEGVRMHWSRLPDLPLLAVLTLAEPILGREAAILLTARLVPRLLGLAFLAAFIWAAAPLLERRFWTRAGLFGLVLMVPQSAFSVGRVDHHGWQLLLAMLGAGALLRMALRPAPSFGPPVIAGLAGALGLWIGAEAIPPVALIAAGSTLIWLARGGQAAARLPAGYGAALTLGVLLIYPLALAPNDWGLKTCDAFSLVSLGLSGAVLSFGLGVMFLERGFSWRGILGRLTAVLPLAALILAGLIGLFPDCRGGPYAANAAAAAEMVRDVIEAQPMTAVLMDRPATAVLFLTLPLLALVLIGQRLIQARPADRRPWLGLLLLTVGGLMLAFWQMRAALLANAYAGIALTCWAAPWMAWGERQRPRWRRLLARLLPLLTIAGLPLALSEAVGALSGKPGNYESGGCALSAVLPVLRDPASVGPGPLLIAAHINQGAELLLNTHHRVLGAPYHRNAGGLEAIAAILQDDPERARRAIAARGVDLIFVCGPETGGSQDRTEPTGFQARLRAGLTPAWLTEIPLPAARAGERLYRVRPEALRP